MGERYLEIMKVGPSSTRLQLCEALVSLPGMSRRDLSIA
jgi:hypothetical protein